MKKIFEYLAKRILELKKPSNIDSVRQKLNLMNPGRAGKELVDEYYIKKLSAVLMLLCAGLLFSALMFISDLGKSRFIGGNVLERNGYGKGDKNVTVDVYADDEQVISKKSLTISERQYTEEEISEIFEEIGEGLRYEILGENESADHVDRDLNLVGTAKDYPVDVEWLISDYTVLDGSGKIKDDYEDNECRTVGLTACLSYGSSKAEYIFYVNVFPKVLSEEEKFGADIDKKIAEYDDMTVSYNRQLLPDEVDGKRISYKTSRENTALYVLVMTLMAAFAIYSGKDSELTKAVKKREREMLIAYPEIVSKLTLLLGAGLNIRAAFEKTALDHIKNHGGRYSFAYEEMLITINRMKSGVSEYEAYLDFGKRCAVKRYVKLGALLSQNIKKGSYGLLSEMEQEVKEAFEDRKAEARKLGEEAGTRLLGPMAMMLAVVMIIVIVPAFLSFSL